MGEPTINEEKFVPWVNRSVVALVPSLEDALAAWQEIDHLGTGPTKSPRILQGEEGRRILDKTGIVHGGTARVIRVLQNLGYKQNVLDLLDEGLMNGHVLIAVPTESLVSESIAEVLERHGGHAMFHFHNGAADSLSGPYQQGHSV
jgi:hypothetical protein